MKTIFIMRNICILVLTLFILICHVDTCKAGSGFEPVINGMVNDAVNAAVSKEKRDSISDTMFRAADVYHSAKSSAAAAQRHLNGTATQHTAKKSWLFEIFKKIESAFLDASLNSNNHETGN